MTNTTNQATAATYTRTVDPSVGREITASLRDLCAREGLEVVATYQDGKDVARRNRAGFARMIAAAEAGEFSAIVCHDLSHLTRRPVELEQIIGTGVRLITASGEVDSTTARFAAALAATEVVIVDE